jgi:ribonuclease J
LVLAIYSAQNIDRLVTLYRAAKRAGRQFVMDLYTASMAAATRSPSIPQASWDDVRVYVPRAQRRQVIAAGAFSRTDAVQRRRVYPEELSAHPERFVMTFRASMCRELEQLDCLQEARCIWSLWRGYLEEPSGLALQQWLRGRAIPLQHHHTSGHATVADLARLVAAVAPGRVVPIHTAAPERFAELFPRVELHDDGELWEV